MSTSAISIIVDDNDVTELCTSIEVYEEMESLIGNSVSTQVKISLFNEDNLLASLLDYPFIFNNKSYLVYSKPEKWTKEVSLTLYDLMIKANVRYKTSLNYPCILSDQLNEMATLIGVEIDTSSLSADVLTKEIGWYDNSLLVRQYLGWIAECDGKNAFIENDKIVFKAIAQNVYETDFCSNFEQIEKITVSRVCFDDGVIEPLASGDDSGRTLYLNENNSYIDSSDVTRIYNMYKGLTFTTIKSFDCFCLPNYKLTDLVTYDDMVILPIVQKVTINGGEADDSVSFSCELGSKTADTVVIADDTKHRVRRVQTKVNQLDGMYSVIAEDVNESKAAISQLELSAKQFEITVGDVEELENEVNTLSTSLSTEADKITALKTEEQIIKDALTGKVDIVSLKKWLEWEGDQLEMGASSDEFKMVLSRIKLAFLQSNVETTWLSNQELWTRVIQATNRISVGEGDGIDGNDNRLSLVDEGDLGYSLM